METGPEGSEQLGSVLALSRGDRWVRGRALSRSGQPPSTQGRARGGRQVLWGGKRVGRSRGDDINLARALLYSGYVAFRHSHLAEAKALWEEL